MRLHPIIWTFIISSNAYTCDNNLQSYSFECGVQDKFLSLNPNIVSTNTPKFILNLSPLLIDIADVTKLETFLSENKIGKLRTNNAEIHPTITYSCEDEKLTGDVIALLNDYDLTNDEGYPLLSLKEIISCKDRKDIKGGKIVFFKNASVKVELNRWIVDFNDTLNRFEKGERLEVSPYHYLADMRRWFVALAPFSNGNEAVADALLFYATKRLHLPTIAPAKEITFLQTLEQSRKEVIDQIKSEFN